MPESDKSGLIIGLDVGSTTVKAVVMDPKSDEILWKDYQRHQAKQPEKVLDFLQRIQGAFSVPQEELRIFITGSGGGMLTDILGAKFVQEVNAVSLAAEHLEPEAGSVIELGGQDAKIIIWFTDQETGSKRKIPSMNDKCAGGTGAVIDKINGKLMLSAEDLESLEYLDIELHPVAGKCGVFAETDINGLQKQGVPSGELMASLFEAIVQQNLSVLTRGNTLRPKVLLLGGPNTFIPGLKDCWTHNILKLWEERNFELPEGVDPQDLVAVPENAQYYAAIGSVLFGKEEAPHVGAYRGTKELESYIEVGRSRLREASGDVGLWQNPEELSEFKKLFAREEWQPASFSQGQRVKAFIGIDGGSTSTKGVIMDAQGNLLAKAYQLSQGNPIADSQDILRELREQVESWGATIEVQGVGTTGYAKDMLKETLGADVAIVETVAHTKSALHYYKDVDVIVDVGGQDIKVILLSNGQVKDFRLNTQCSAGNGYFLQSTAARFGYSVSEFADVAFEADRVPVFGYGCAVFMETDIVNFQQMGWEKKEIMAGLAKVLPKNIWLYVVAEPNLSKFGTRFVLQGGTQYNMAAVKSQYDFIKSKVPGAQIRVHQHAGESGAIGAALEAVRVAADQDSSFVGLATAENLEFTATKDESTRCNYCKNKCLRTYIDTQTPLGKRRRFIIATCEKGAVENLDDMRVVKAQLDDIKRANPNFVERASVQTFRSLNPPTVSTPEEQQEPASPQGWALGRFGKKAQETSSSSVETRELRRNIKIGIPRVLNMYSVGPFFQAYFEALGLNAHNIIYSDYTSPQMWFRGSRRGSIDQCFPSKATIAHVHNLIFDQKEMKKPDIIFFPIIRKTPSGLVNTLDSAACPVVSISPDMVRAAFTKEGDIFEENGIEYLTPRFDMKERAIFELQMHDCFVDVLGVTAEENREAMDIAFKVWLDSQTSFRADARRVLEQLEQEGKVGVVLLGRPYHSDPGLNHEITEEIQKKGYPIFSIDSLPRDEDILDRLFGDEVRAGVISDPLDITDVWKNAYSENTSLKLWAAKFVARHPNLVAIDLSNFKCGQDAPIFDVVERIIEATGTPYFTFHDIDENKPLGFIKIRGETIDYFLQRYQEYLQRQINSENELQRMVQDYRARLELASLQQTNGNNSQPGVNGFAPLGQSKNGQAPVAANLGNPIVNGAAPDSSVYDSLLDENAHETAGHGPGNEELANSSASCPSPNRDYPHNAYIPKNGAGAQPVELVKSSLLRKKKAEEEISAD